jgi:vesicle coat complex subunit
VISGNIVYKTTSVLDRNVVVLNNIHIDIMDNISPATCPHVAFRNTWQRDKKTRGSNHFSANRPTNIPFGM